MAVTTGAVAFVLTVNVETEVIHDVDIDTGWCTMVVSGPSNKFQWDGEFFQQKGEVRATTAGTIHGLSGSTFRAKGSFGTWTDIGFHPSTGIYIFDGVCLFEWMTRWAISGTNLWIFNSTLTLHNSVSVTTNDSTILASGTGNQSFAFLSGHIHRIDNQNTGGQLIFTQVCALDGIHFNSGTESVSKLGVTLTGLTPSLGTTPYHSRQDLLDNGYIFEDPGLWIFDNDFKYAHGWIMRHGLNSVIKNDGIVEIVVEKGIDHINSWAKIFLHDPDRSLLASFPMGCQIKVFYFDGTEWQSFFKGFVLEATSTGQVGSTTYLYCPGYSWFLNAQFSFIFSHRAHTLLEMLECIITFCTPFTWVAANISMKTSGNTATPEFDGVTVMSAIIQILSYSDNEEFGINAGREFFIQQRATSHNGTRDADLDVLDGDITDYSIEDIAKDRYNLYHLIYGTDTERRGMYTWDFAGLIEPFSTQLALGSCTSLDEIIIRPLISDADYALAEAFLDTAYSFSKPETIFDVTVVGADFESADPGQITQLTLAEQGYSLDAKKIASVQHSLKSCTTRFQLIEPTNIIGLGQKRAALMNIYDEQKRMNYSYGKFSQFGLMSITFSSFADWSEWTLLSKGACHANGYLYATGNTGGSRPIAEIDLLEGAAGLNPVGTAAYPYSLEKDYSNYRHILTSQIDMKQNDGTMYIVLSWFGDSVTLVEYDDIRDIYTYTPSKSVGLTLFANWNGVGTSPRLNWLRLPFHAWENP